MKALVRLHETFVIKRQSNMRVSHKTDSTMKAILTKSFAYFWACTNCYMTARDFAGNITRESALMRDAPPSHCHAKQHTAVSTSKSLPGV